MTKTFGAECDEDTAEACGNQLSDASAGAQGSIQSVVVVLYSALLLPWPKIQRLVWRTIQGPLASARGSARHKGGTVHTVLIQFMWEAIRGG